MGFSDVVENKRLSIVVVKVKFTQFLGHVELRYANEIYP